MVLPDSGSFESESNFPLEGLGLRDFLLTSGASLFTEITNGSELLSFLRDNGVRIGNEDFYDIRRQVLYSVGQVDSFREPLSAVSADNPDVLIPEAFTATPTWDRQSYEYLYKVEIHGTNPENGEQTSEFMMVGSDDQLTWNDVRDIARSYIPSGKSSAGNIVDALTLDSVYSVA